MDEGLARIFSSRDFEGLRSRIVGRKIYKYDTVNSTNDLAFMRALEGEKEGAVFWARSQTKGRGRLGRTWTSHKDKGLYFSVILKPDISVGEASAITLMAALAMVMALRKFSSREFLIKWPNDIVINDKKIGGILTEMDAEVKKVKFIILGIGINTNMTQVELPIKEATSLKIEIHREINPQGLIAACIKELDDFYLEFKKNGPSRIIEESRSLSSLWGRQVRIEDVNHRDTTHKTRRFWEGTALDFDQDGSLVIRQHNGFLRHIFSGDVKLLR